MRPTQGAEQRPIWCCRHGRLRFAKKLSRQLRIRNSFCSCCRVSLRRRRSGTARNIARGDCAHPGRKTAVETRGPTQPDVRKALVVAQHDVEARLVRLDEVELEQQRLGLGVRDRDFDVGDLLDERLDLGIDVGGAEVGGRRGPLSSSPCRRTGGALRIDHAIYAGTPRQRRDKLLGIKRARHLDRAPRGCRLAPPPP